MSEMLIAVGICGLSLAAFFGVMQFVNSMIGDDPWLPAGVALWCRRIIGFLGGLSLVPGFVCLALQMIVLGILGLPVILIAHVVMWALDVWERRKVLV
jgi:hypothetical protein